MLLTKNGKRCNYLKLEVLLIDEVERELLTQLLSEQYSQNIINIEEYERLLEYINKIETKKK